MDATRLKEVMEWVRSTDLAEVSFSEGRLGFSFQSAAGAPADIPFFSGPKLVPVTSAGVGLFQWSEPGKPRLAEEGASVEEGAVLGIIDTGLKKTLPVKSPCAGRIARVLIDGGDSAQYGQPLFIIEPRS